MIAPALTPSQARDFVAAAHFQLVAFGFRPACRVWLPGTIHLLVEVIADLEREAVALAQPQPIAA